MTKAQSQAQIDGSSTWTISGPLTDHHVKKKSHEKVQGWKNTIWFDCYGPSMELTGFLGILR